MPRRTGTVGRGSSKSRKSQDNSEASSETLEPVSEESDSSKISDLKDLVFLGRLQSDVVISGYTFSLATLTSTESKDIYAEIITADGTSRVTEIKPIVLSRAIQSVNGAPLEDLYDGDEDLDVYDIRNEVISGWQSILVDKLYQEYEKIVVRSNSDFGIDEIKK